MPKTKNKFPYLLIIVAVASFFRLLFLDRFPTGISNDEMHFILNAKAVFYRFTDMSGHWFPLSFTTIPHETSSELTFILLAPIIGPLPTNLFTARLPFALIGVITITILYYLTLNLSRNYTLAVITSLVAALNPWSIYVNRTSFDAPLSLMFFLLCLLLMAHPKPKYILFSIIPGILAFYTYIGTKIIYFPFVVLSSFLLWKYVHSKKNIYPLTFVTLFSFVITLIYFINLFGSDSFSRISELITPSSPQLSSQVFLEKSQSLQSPFKPIFTNNLTLFLRHFIDKYLANFSPDIFFSTGDHTYMVSLWKHGYFYYLDALLFILGLLFLYKKYPKLLVLILGLIALSPIPEAIRADKIPAYAFHSVLQYPFLYIIIAAGILFFFQKIKFAPFRLIFILLYLFSFGNFLDIYFFKYPLYQPEGFRFSYRLASHLISLESQKNRSVYFLTSEPNTLFRAYLFYTNSYLPSTFDQVKIIYTGSRDDITFDKIHFVNHPQLLPKNDNYTLIYDQNNYQLQPSGSRLTITQISDAAKIFTVYRSLTCQNIELSPFVHNLNLFDLQLEHLSEDKFCTKFITQTI